MRQNIGIYQKGEYVAKRGGLHTKEYKLWFAMLTRCYSNTYKEKEPSYINCMVSENFKNFQFFARWCNRQVGFNLEDFQLDKDILVKGNKVYSEETCCFVPRQINNLFTLSKRARGDLPIGVYKDDTGRSAKLYKAVCKTLEDKNQKSLGRFHTIGEAFSAYKTCKESVIKQAAEIWRENIDPRVYQALVSYVVEVTD